MEFQEILAYKPTIVSTVALLALLVGAGLATYYYYLFTSFKKGDEDPKDFPFPIITLAYAAGVFFVISSIAFIMTSNLYSANEESLASNIKQKYNVDEVIFDNVNETYEGDAVDTLPRLSAAQSVKVVRDGITYRLILTQDKSTWEPTLTNTDVPYKEAKVLDVPVESLLK